MTRERKRLETLDIKLCSYKTFHSSARLLFVCFFYFYLFFFWPGCSQFFLAGEEKILGDMDFGVCTHSFRAKQYCRDSVITPLPSPPSSFIYCQSEIFKWKTNSLDASSCYIFQDSQFRNWGREEIVWYYRLSTSGGSLLDTWGAPDLV
jgi:hypothetical protein